MQLIPGTNKISGTGTVVFDTVPEATKAVQTMQGHAIYGSKVRLAFTEDPGVPAPVRRTPVPAAAPDSKQLVKKPRELPSEWERSGDASALGAGLTCVCILHTPTQPPQPLSLQYGRRPSCCPPNSVAVLFFPPAPFVETSDGTQTNTVFLTGLPNDTTEDALKGALSGVKPSFVIGG